MALIKHCAKIKSAESSAAKAGRNMGHAMNSQEAMRKDYVKSLWCIILLFFIIGIPGQGLSYSKDESVVAAVTALREITSVDQLLEYLDDQEWFNRFAAIQVLGERKDGRAVEPLLAMLKHENDPAFRKEILSALTGIGGRGVVEPLLTVLKDEQDSSTRKDIFVALAEMNDPRAITAFVDELEKDTFQFYDDPEIYLVRLVNGAQDSAMVLPALHARDVAVRQAAAAALDKLGWRPSNKEQEVLYSAAKREWEKCVLLGSFSVDVLAELLNDAYWSEHASEIGLALGRINDTRAFAVLERALQSDMWYLRETTAEVLGDLGDPRGVEPLIRAVSDHDERVSSKAVEALGKMKASQAQPALVAALMHEDSRVRKAAAAALEAMAWNPSTPQEKAAYYTVKQDTEACVALGQAAVAPLLVSASDSFDFEGRDFAVAALAEIGPPAVEPLLAEFAS
ncbi:MAG TPA: HEAT repeat domain-containing protein, partial [Candidatus Omnitrophota bacterium]|nr:HEAT repeat domain-containing protein [Candidatus Omnitrophota bacterium]